MITPTICNKSEQCVSTDQMESSNPGIILQLKGRLTKGGHRCTTVYVDHASRHSYVYVQRSMSSKKTYLSKKLFEQYPKKLRIQVQHYHCDNG